MTIAVLRLGVNKSTIQRYESTEAMLRKAMNDYESKKFVAKADNLTVGELLDLWVQAITYIFFRKIRKL